LVEFLGESKNGGGFSGSWRPVEKKVREVVIVEECFD
jgi:hypothetical protein